MKPAPFALHRPERLDDALALLARHADSAKLIAGGQSLVPLMNLRMATPDIVVDLGRIRELGAITASPDGLAIGATVRQAELLRDAAIAEHAPLLRDAVRHIGHVQTRARGTIGGSVAHADPAAELPAVLVALDARFRLRSLRGERLVPAAGFFLGALSTAIAEDEILCEILVPKAGAGARHAFREIARRQGDFAIVSAAVLVRPGPDGRPVLSACLGGVEPAPVRCVGLEARFPDLHGDPGRVAALVTDEIVRLEPMGDLHAGSEYRGRLASILLTETLQAVLTP